MIGLAPLVVVALVLAGVYAAGHHSHHPAAPTGPAGLSAHGGQFSRAVTHHPSRPLGRHPLGTVAPSDTPLDGTADAPAAWTGAGIITAEQAEAIRAYERNAAELADAVGSRGFDVADVADEVTPRRVPFVAEALGYLGGVLGIVGVVLLMARYWPDMSTPGRLALSGGSAAALALAGALVHEGEPALTRLRWFLWLLSSVAGGVFAGVLGTRAWSLQAADKVVLVVATVVTLQNAAFWWWHERPVQQFLTLVGAATLVGTLVAQFTGEGLTGLALLCVGIVLAAAGWRNLTPAAALTAAVGGATMVVGSSLSVAEWHGWGMALMLAAVGALAVAAALPNGRCTPAVRVALTVVGGAGALQAVPPAIVHFSDQAGILTGVVVWLTGAVLVWLGSARTTRAPLVVEVLGGVGIVGGGTVMAFQSVAVATLTGLVTAVCLIALGTMPGRVLMSLFGSAGLLVNVPWAITHFFPGEGRVPVLILACGAVIVAVAVWLARMGGRFRDELRRPL